jgi:molecular chaperone DnaK (HSP70)
VKSQSISYLVGIDLGTTHTVVAYANVEKKRQDIQLFEIEQLIAPGQVAARNLLPSVRYHPALGELSADEIAFPIFFKTPHSPHEAPILGEAARVLGAKSKGRLVTSAKSWLSHPSVDPSATILPWGSNDDINKVSPIDASASYLAHIRTVWDHKFPHSPLAQQDIVITVPASFDELARSLTIEAATKAGLKKVKLLEEPQAVCYDWLHFNSDTIKQDLVRVHLLLVCDVGGGTTDLTLIKVEQGVTEPKLTRIGVGDHLMLGGDNIDLALAHLAESRMNTLTGSEKRFSASDLSQLIEQCRIVKELLLAKDAPEQASITLLGGGSKLIGGSRSIVFTRDEVKTLALDGFFPLSTQDELPEKKRSGVVEFGLPYSSEPAISKHIAAFLKLHSTVCREALKGEGSVPDALLLNGGVFRSQLITQRLVNLLTSWGSKPPVLLENSRPELSVAYGAVSYGLARLDKKIKIGGGSALSYFLVIDTDKLTVKKGICILPRGSEEGDELVLKNHQFALRLGQPVRFHLATITGDVEYKLGDLVSIKDSFHSLPPLAVAFESDTERTKTEVVVELAVTQTEVGTLKIQCVSIENKEQRWNVEFQIRKGETGSLSDDALPPQFNAAADKIKNAFGSRSKDIDPKSVKNLRADLEKQIGCARTEWQVPLLRALFTSLLEGSKYNRRSENHERIWLSLTGFCLRPGFGAQLDDWRVEQVWKLYSQGIQFVNEAQNWSEWWTLWRRIAGGLSSTAQERIFLDIAKYLNPAAARQAGVAKQIKTRGYDDMVRLAAVLERLSVDKKIQLGDWLLKRLEKANEPSQTWWAVGRIGSRLPFHGSRHQVVSTEVACRWLTQILAEDWKKTPQAGFAATLIARMSGDRACDINEEMRQQVIGKLKLSKAPSSWIDMVEHFKELDEKEESQMFGEALPPGLTLINNK